MKASRTRLVLAGLLWAAVYNLLWGAAWFTFMRREWHDAAAALGRPNPFGGAEVWLVMAALSLPIGIAILAYAAGHALSPAQAALRASLLIWVLMTMGMTGWGLSDSYSARVLALDSMVNFIAMLAAALAGVWMLRRSSH